MNADADPGSAAGANVPRWRRLLQDYLHDLFDLQFRTIVATRMLPGVYGLGIALAAVFSVYLVFLGFRDAVWEGFVWLLLLGPALFIGLVTALRITLEFVLAVFRIAWYVEHVAGRTEEIQKEMPRFGWWGTLLFGDRAAPPPGGRKPPEP